MEHDNGAPGAGGQEQDLAVPAETGGKERDAADPAQKNTQRDRDADAKFADYRRRTEAELRRVQADAQAAVQAERDRAQTQSQRDARARAQLYAQDQLRRIGQLDPSVRTMAELRRTETFPALESYVGKGLTLEEAFKLANYDQMRSRTARAAEQGARNGDAGKSHLRALAGRTGQGTDDSVPAEVVRAFRQAKPGISDREIRDKYRRFRKYARQ